MILSVGEAEDRDSGVGYVPHCGNVVKTIFEYSVMGAFEGWRCTLDCRRLQMR